MILINDFRLAVNCVGRYCSNLFFSTWEILRFSESLDSNIFKWVVLVISIVKEKLFAPLDITLFRRSLSVLLFFQPILQFNSHYVRPILIFHVFSKKSIRVVCDVNGTVDRHCSFIISEFWMTSSFANIPMRWSPLTLITRASQFGFWEWLAKRILFPWNIINELKNS